MATLAELKQTQKMDFQERVRRRNEFDGSLVFGTQKFNRSTEREQHYDWRKENDSSWMNPVTGVIYDHFASHRDCPLCGENEHDLIFVKAGFPHVKCKQCSLVYVEPVLNEKEYEKFCSAEDAWESVLETDNQIKLQSLEADYSLDIAELYINGGEDISICDVGCGPGTSLSQAKKRGYDVFGIEPNTRCHNTLIKSGIDFTAEFFPLKTKVEKRFDCIITFNVLEHLPDPKKVVLEMKKLLKPKGILYISVPHINALVSRILQEKSGVFGGHTHIQFFSNITLANLLEECGFEVLEYETIITEIGIIQNYLSYKDPYLGDGGEYYDLITPESMYKNHLARNLNMVSQLK